MAQAAIARPHRRRVTRPRRAPHARHRRWSEGGQGRGSGSAWARRPPSGSVPGPGDRASRPSSRPWLRVRRCGIGGGWPAPRHAADHGRRPGGGRRRWPRAGAQASRVLPTRHGPVMIRCCPFSIQQPSARCRRGGGACSGRKRSPRAQAVGAHPVQPVPARAVRRPPARPPGPRRRRRGAHRPKNSEHRRNACGQGLLSCEGSGQSMNRLERPRAECAPSSPHRPLRKGNLR